MSSFPSSDAIQPYVVVAGADDGPDGRRVIEAALIDTMDSPRNILCATDFGPFSKGAERSPDPR